MKDELNVLDDHHIYDVHDLHHYVKDELNVLDGHHIYDVHDLHHYVKDELNDQGIYDQNVLDVLHDLHVHDG